MSASDRAKILDLINESVAAGSTQMRACEVIGLSERRVQRWALTRGQEDLRHGPKTAPANKLSDEERARIVALAASKEFCDMSPHQIVPKLADKGEYIASESSFYRVLKAAELLAHRGRSKPRTVSRPRGHEVFAPRQLFSWDITYLKSLVLGQYFYLYLFLDVFSRKIVGWRVHEKESAEYSSQLLTEICLREGVERNKVSVHSDNGSPMKGATMLVTMQRLGVMPSFSRPSVSDDNPFSEALFKTMKYCPMYPSNPFASIEDATKWVAEFVVWYNTQCLHSGISFTTPESRHNGDDEGILKQRDAVYRAAKQEKPQRWSGSTRNWKKVDCVRLNWLKEKESSTTKADCQQVG